MLPVSWKPRQAMLMALLGLNLASFKTEALMNLEVKWQLLRRQRRDVFALQTKLLIL